MLDHWAHNRRRMMRGTCSPIWSMPHKAESYKILRCTHGADASNTLNTRAHMNPATQWKTHYAHGSARIIFQNFSTTNRHDRIRDITTLPLTDCCRFREAWIDPSFGEYCFSGLLASMARKTSASSAVARILAFSRSPTATSSVRRVIILLSPFTVFTMINEIQ